MTADRRPMTWLRGWPPVTAATIVSCLAVTAVVVPYLWASALDSDTLMYFASIDLGVQGPFDLHRHGDRDGSAAWVAKGLLAWSEDPTSRGLFMRPLGGVLFWASYEIFGRSHFPHYAVNVVFFWGFLAAAAALLRRSLPASLAVLTLLILAVDDMHSEPVFFWASSSHALPAAVLGALALMAHIRWRQGWRPGVWVFVGISLLGFAMSEFYFCSLAFVLGFEIAGFPSRERRVRATVPAAALAVGYIIVHKLGGYGTVGWSSHVDPFSDPMGALRTAAENIRLLPETIVFGSDILGPWRALAVLALATPFAVQGIRSRPVEQRRAICGLLLGSLLTLVPVLSAQWRWIDEWVSDRNLLYFDIGVSLFWALALSQAVAWARGRAPLAGRAAAGIAALGVVGIVFVWSPMHLGQRLKFATGVLTGGYYHGVSTIRDGFTVCGQGKEIVWLRAESGAPNLYYFVGEVLGRDAEWHPPLVLFPGGERRGDVARVAERTLQLHDETMLSPADATHFYPRPPVRVPGGAVRIVPHADGSPRLEVTFDDDVEDHCFLSQSNGEVAQVPLPAVGKSATF